MHRALRLLTFFALWALAGLTGCLITDDFDVYSASGRVRDGGEPDGPTDGAADGSSRDLGPSPTCTCTRGMTTTADCDLCAHRECDGCHFGACVLNTGAQCEYRGGTNTSSTGCGSSSCRRCLPPDLVRRVCTPQCRWSECQCCGPSGCGGCT